MVFTVSPLDAPSCDQQGNIIPKREPRIEERKVSLPLRKSPSIVFSWPEFVIKSQCSELMAPTKNLVQVRYTDTIRSVLWTLIKNKVESVPVYNEATRKYAGVVDMFDLVQYIASAAGNAVTRSDFFQVFKRQAFADAQVSKITHSGAKDQCVSVPESSPISGLFDLTVASNLPRVPVMNRQKILGMVSQSDIVQYLVQNKSNFSQLSAKAIKDLTIAGADNVYTIEENTPTVSAFVYMAEKGVKGLAVVNSEGQFVDAINSLDVEGLVHGDFFSDLRQPVLRYLSKSRILLGKNLVPVVCTPEDTLADMLSKMAQEKVCRVFVIGADRKPTSVISLRDILKLMYTFIPDAPSISAGSGCQ